jgi:hypothetical protein
MKISQMEWANFRHQFLGQLAQRAVNLTLRDRVWAATDTGGWIALPGTSDSPDADKWWLGCDPEKLRARRAMGVVLLCKSRGGPLHAIGLPRALLDDLWPKLVKNQRHVFFNVARRGGRFLLQLRGGEQLDVTGRLDDFSWIADAGEASSASGGMHSFAAGAPIREHSTTPFEDGERAEPETQGPPIHRFFAIVRNKTLHPLDEVALEPGSLYLVEVREAPVVPGNTSLRRIVARGGPENLPPDFADRHDYYAHGAGRR